MLATSLAAALPGLALASPPSAVAASAQADAPRPSARALGLSEGILNFCGPREPAAAATLQQKISELVQRASAQQLAEVRSSDEYRKAYDSVVEFAAKIDEHNVKTFCTNTPGGR